MALVWISIFFQLCICKRNKLLIMSVSRKAMPTDVCASKTVVYSPFYHKDLSRLYSICIYSMERICMVHIRSLLKMHHSCKLLYSGCDVYHSQPMHLLHFFFFKVINKSATRMKPLSNIFVWVIESKNFKADIASGFQ